MTDITSNFNPIPRLQQIAATIEESGGRVFDSPQTAVHYINCAINEIERLRKEAFALSAWSCREIDRITAERDEARQERDAVKGYLEAADDVRIRCVAAIRAERDRARRLVCELQCDPPERFIGLPHEVAQMYGWDCFPEATP